MARPWLAPYRRDNELKVFNKATAWTGPVSNAIRSFNNLKLGVKLTPTTEINKANIVVILATGPTEYPHKDPWYEATVKTDTGFDPKKFHGSCKTLMDSDKKFQIVFAAIFLPGSIKATDGQKEVVVVHEFIHACGLNGVSEDGNKDANQDHDIEGIMVSIMKIQGKGMIEYMPLQGAIAMPPIRIGGQSFCKAKAIWLHPDQC